MPGKTAIHRNWSLSDEVNSPYVLRGGDLHLSTYSQRELLLAMMERSVPLRTTARGFSMHPFICDKDVLTVSPIKERQPTVGEVVAFIQPNTGKLAIHRIIKRTGNGWLIKGDNCPSPDGIVAADKIIGRVVRIERNGKDVRLGIGKESRFIAVLNRGTIFVSLKQIWMLPHRTASYALRALQCLSIYRWLGRQVTTRPLISESDEHDMEVVHNRLDPFGTYSKETPNPNVVNLVAKNGEDLMGFVQLVYHPSAHAPWEGFWLFSLHVWTRHRGMGIGSALTRRVIEESEKRGAAELSLVVNESNKRAIRLYQKLGFDIIYHPGLAPLLEKEKKESGRRRIVMRKKIGEPV